MDAEVDRAMVWQIDAATGAHKPYATGLRNPHSAGHPARHRHLVDGGQRA
jgi:glucose/arabinose dehydrogenase